MAGGEVAYSNPNSTKAQQGRRARRRREGEGRREGTYWIGYA